MCYKSILAWILLFSIALPSCLSAQERAFYATASASKVGLEDPLQVRFIIQNGESVANFNPPGFMGFRVLGGPFQSNQSSVSIINGRRSESATITLTYMLQPIRTGKLTIPAASIVINGNQYESDPITVEVVKGHLAAAPQAQSSSPFNDPFFGGDPFDAARKQEQRLRQLLRQRAQQYNGRQQNQIADLDEKNLSKNVFIKVTVDNTHPYVGEQITASYKLYTRLPMNMSLTQLPSLNGFWSEDFDIPNPPRPHEEIVDGKPYQVFLLKKSALFPQQTGKLTLDAARAEGIVRVIHKVQGQNPFAADPAAGSLFMDDPLFNSDFFSGYDYKDVKTKISSEPVTIQVMPLPGNNQPAGFSGGVGRFNIHTEMDSTVLSTDGGGAFRFVISGSGNLKLIGPPEIDFPEALGATDPQLSDTILSRNPVINGTKTFRYDLSPQQPGKYTIPAITFSYFDPASGSYKTLRTNPVSLKVVAGAHYAVAKEALPADIHDIIRGPFEGKAPHGLFMVTAGYWGLYGVALLLFGFLWFRHKRKEGIATDSEAWKKKTANKVAWKRLAQARKVLGQQDTVFYEEVSKAIWLYLSDKLNIPLSALSRENIAEKLAFRQVPAAQVAAVNRLISECELALYSRTGGLQQRSHTLDVASTVIGELEGILQGKKFGPLRSKPAVPLVLAGVIVAACCGQALAQSVSSDWAKANAFYGQQQYDSALAHYRAIDRTGVRDGALFYNIGNCYYRLGQTGPAILYYERALHANPRSERAADNLALAQARVQMPVTPVKRIFFISWWEDFVLALPPQAWSWLMFVLFITGLGMIYVLRRGKPRISYAGRWMSIIITGFIVRATLAYFSYSARNTSDKVVVMQGDTPFFSTIGDRGSVQGKLPEGAVLRIREKRKGYYSVTLPNGSQAWVAGSAVEQVGAF
jgi:tetratricopeptide (TPR) repeat protein